MTKTLGLPSAEQQDSFTSEAAVTIISLAQQGPAERRETLSGVLASYIGQSHADVRADTLKDALDAFQKDSGIELVSKSEWAQLSKAFRAELAGKSKADRRERYADAVAREAEFTEAVYVDKVVEERLEGEFVYASGFGWLSYTGTHWKPVDAEVVTEAVRQHAVETAAAQLQAGFRDPKDLLAMMKKTFVANVTSLASGVLRVPAEALDGQPDFLNVANGTVDLRTGVLRPHSADNYFTKCAPTDYVPGATDPAWTQALSSMEAETADWMQLRYGNGITGHPADDHRMCFLNGSGGNGKSMHLDGIGNALGSGKHGYFAALSEGALIGKDTDKEAIMSLRGARLAVAEELPEGRQLNVTTLKRFIGTKRMTGRHLYQKEVTWDVSHSLFVTSNYDLNVNESDDGTWRRLAKVPFPYSYVDSPSAPHERLKDRSLSGRLETRSAREACLAWLVQGAIRWYKEGLSDLNTPGTVKAATLAWRAESDAVLKFFGEFLVPAPGHHIASSDMLKVFNGFMEAQSQASWSAKTLVSRAKDHASFRGAGIEQRKVRGGTGDFPVASRKGYAHESLPAQYSAFVGVRFRTEADDAVIEPDPIPATEPQVPAEAVQTPAQASYAAEVGFPFDAMVSGPQAASEGVQWIVPPTAQEEAESLGLDGWPEGSIGADGQVQSDPWL